MYAVHALRCYACCALTHKNAVCLLHTAAQQRFAHAHIHTHIHTDAQQRFVHTCVHAHTHTSTHRKPLCSAIQQQRRL